MGLHAELVLIAILRLMHLWIALAVPVLDRTGRMDDRGIDNGALAQRQPLVSQVGIDCFQDDCRQLVFPARLFQHRPGGLC